MNNGGTRVRLSWKIRDTFLYYVLMKENWILFSYKKIIMTYTFGIHKYIDTK